ncbi:MAG: adenylosuccinate synthase [Anaerolineae bacterium]|nr:adenylosuccinate synthase [Anaerolineae bacterium]
MTVTAVVGAQWGDEGKGRTVDYMAQQADLVIRFQGGDNAGHTVVNAYGEFRLHLVPSGIFNPRAVCLLGAGTVANLDVLAQELAELESRGVSTDQLRIDKRAHLVLPYHRLLDGAEESARTGGWAVGTTRRGIGPAYADKAGRHGIRVGDLLDPERLGERLETLVPRKNRELAFYGLAETSVEQVMGLCLRWREQHAQRIVDAVPIIRDAVRRSKNVLLEGQLGVMRDLDWGIYPFTTSSSPTAGGACVGAGIPPSAIDEVLGVVKAFSTSVGGGPFPTELHGAAGELLRRGGPVVGHEFGATTGRPRRCGWFDGVAVGYASWLNGFTGISVTKLDVLDPFEALQVCVGYRVDDEVIDYVPDTATQERVVPVYETWPGWMADTSGCRRWDDLPGNARAYLRRIESLAGAPIRFISVGPQRDQMIAMECS